MKIDWKRFFAFSFLVAFCYFLLSAGVLLLAADNETWTFFGLSGTIWYHQFVISLVFFLVFLFLFLFTSKWKFEKYFFSKELFNNASGLQELWIALILVLLFVGLGGMDLTFWGESSSQKISNVQDKILETKAPEPPAQGQDETIKTLADFLLSEVADYFQGMDLAKVQEKISSTGLVVPGDDPTLGEVAQANVTGINTLIDIISRGEQLVPGKRLGKPVGKRTLAEALPEIGISETGAQTIMKNNQIRYSGNPATTLGEIARKNKLLAVDLYALLNGKKVMPTSNEQNKKADPQEMLAMISTKTIKELTVIIKESQPEANVTVGLIIERMKANQVMLPNKNLTLGEIATQNKMSIDDLMQTITTGHRPKQPPVPGAKKLEGPPTHLDMAKNNARRVITYSISKLATQYHLDETKLLEALRNKGYEATKHQSIEDIAKAYNVRPGAIFQIIKVEKDRQEAEKANSDE